MKKRLNAFTKDKFATVVCNVLCIHSIANEKVVAKDNYPKLINFGTISPIYMNESYLVLANKQSNTKNFFVYDTNGKFIMERKNETAATVLIYNCSKKITQGTVDGKGNFKVKISMQQKILF